LISNTTLHIRYGCGHGLLYVTCDYTVQCVCKIHVIEMCYNVLIFEYWLDEDSLNLIDSYSMAVPIIITPYKVLVAFSLNDVIICIIASGISTSNRGNSFLSRQQRPSQPAPTSVDGRSNSDSPALPRGHPTAPDNFNFPPSLPNRHPSTQEPPALPDRHPAVSNTSSLPGRPVPAPPGMQTGSGSGSFGSPLPERPPPLLPAGKKINRMLVLTLLMIFVKLETIRLTKTIELLNLYYSIA